MLCNDGVMSKGSVAMSNDVVALSIAGGAGGQDGVQGVGLMTNHLKRVNICAKLF